MRPSHVFDNSEDAIESMCRGCEHERGWIDMVRTRYPRCQCMVDIECDIDGSIKDVEDMIVCRRLADRRKDELAKYRKRMRGDWS